ncbi:MAG: transporter substrate-binding domain-containing protein [Rhodospirillales bacterium]|nr:transporter substrate-binding domain-containing protein [Rhodospirillales bacterium]
MGLAASTVAPAAAQSRFELITAPIPPLAMDDASQPGFLVDLILDLSEHVHKVRPDFQLDPTVAVLPWKRAIRTAEVRPFKLFAPAARTPEREQKFVWISPLLKIDFAFATIGKPINSFEEAMALDTVAVYGGSAHEDTLIKKGFSNLVPASAATNARKLAAGRVDAWYSTIPEALWQWKILDLDPTVVTGKPIFSRLPWLVGTKDFPRDLVPVFRQQMKHIVADGTYERLYIAYFGRPPPPVSFPAD